MKVATWFTCVAVVASVILLTVIFQEASVPSMHGKRTSQRVVMYSLLENISSVKEICQEISSGDLLEIRTTRNELKHRLLSVNSNNNEKLITTIFIDTTEDSYKKLCIQYMEIIPRPNLPPEQTT